MTDRYAEVREKDKDLEVIHAKPLSDHVAISAVCSAGIIGASFFWLLRNLASPVVAKVSDSEILKL